MEERFSLWRKYESVIVFGLWGRDRDKKNKQAVIDWRWKGHFFQFALPLHDSSARGGYGGAFTWETVEMWPDADKVDFLRHLDDLTEDHCLSPLIGIRYSWANEALNLLISLDPSPDHSGLFCFLSSWCTTADTPHACVLLHKWHTREPSTEPLVILF